MLTIREYALQLLQDSKCDLNSYAEVLYWNGQEIRGGYERAYDDLQFTIEAQGQVHPYSIEELAKELVAIGNEQPIPPRKGHKKYCMVFENENNSNGIECDTFDEAKSQMLDTYLLWTTDEMREWAYNETGVPLPTEEQIERYDYMIANCSCCVVKWDDDLDDWQDSDNAYGLSQDELDEIGFVEWERLHEIITSQTKV